MRNILLRERKIGNNSRSLIALSMKVKILDWLVIMRREPLDAKELVAKLKMSMIVKFSQIQISDVDTRVKHEMYL